MSVFRLALVASVVTFAVACSSGSDSSSDDPGTNVPEVVSPRSFYLSASTVEALDERLDGVTPPVLTANAGHTPASYLGPASALGPVGPLSAWGPLGALGPVGDASWNPSTWMSAVGDWRKWSNDMTGLDGPLSESGPLGPNGPLSRTAYQSLGALNDWSKQLQAGGVFTALGPLGPLGALGPLGPLGPVGAHGFASSPDGDYLDNGRVVRNVDVPYEGSTRSYDLVEKYTEAHAKAMRDNDTSFLVMGSIDDVDSEVDAYDFNSNEEQLVTIVVVPENSLSDFDVEVASGRTVVKSDSSGRQGIGPFGLFVDGHYIDFVQLTVARGAKLTARVSAKTTHAGFPTYRLIVTGSTKFVPTMDIRGPHQKSL
jgi:hypothetical protein